MVWREWCAWEKRETRIKYSLTKYHYQPQSLDINYGESAKRGCINVLFNRDNSIIWCKGVTGSGAKWKGQQSWIKDNFSMILEQASLQFQSTRNHTGNSMLPAPGSSAVLGAHLNWIRIKHLLDSISILQKQVLVLAFFFPVSVVFCFASFFSKSIYFFGEESLVHDTIHVRCKSMAPRMTSWNMGNTHLYFSSQLRHPGSASSSFYV